MLGSEVPDLSSTPCVACGERVAAAEVVWDAWHTGDSRFAALPWHRACAAPILPPEAPTDAMRTCGRCTKSIASDVFDPAFSALKARFEAAQGSLASPEVVWRLAGRAPRAYVAEHFACVLAAATAPRNPPGPDKV